MGPRGFTHQIGDENGRIRQKIPILSLD